MLKWCNELLDAQCLTDEIEIISLYFKGLDMGIIQAKVEVSAPSSFGNPD